MLNGSGGFGEIKITRPCWGWTHYSLLQSCR